MYQYTKKNKLKEPWMEASTPSFFSRQKKMLLIGLVVAVIGALGFTTFYFYRQYKTASNPEAAMQKEIQALEKTLGQFMDLPTDEVPQLATVTDSGKLKDRSFFVRAQNGDKVLLYSKSMKVILYRPSTGKIIEASTVSGGDNNVADQALPDPQPK
jgi:hypothetical protein